MSLLLHSTLPVRFKNQIFGALCLPAALLSQQYEVLVSVLCVRACLYRASDDARLAAISTHPVIHLPDTSSVPPLKKYSDFLSTWVHSHSGSNQYPSALPYRSPLRPTHLKLLSLCQTPALFPLRSLVPIASFISGFTCTVPGSQMQMPPSSTPSGSPTNLQF